jgi:flagellar hook-length control protein FliK
VDPGPEALPISEHDAEGDSTAEIVAAAALSAPLAAALPLAVPAVSAAGNPQTIASIQDVPARGAAAERLGPGAAVTVTPPQVEEDISAAALPRQPAVVAGAPAVALESTVAPPLLPQTEASAPALPPDVGTQLAAPALEAPREAVARAPAASPLYAGAVPVHSARFADEVGNRIVWMAGHTQQVAELRLDPPQLGPLEVRLSISGEQATLTLLSAQPAVRDALQASLPRLMEMMHGAGIDLGSVFVGAQSSGQHPGDGAPEHSGAGPLRMLETDLAAASAGAGLIRVAHGAVDVYA